MVRTTATKLLFYGLLVFSCALLSSCSRIKSWFGEKPPTPPVVHVEQSSSGCLDAMAILKSSEEESNATLECWLNKVTDLWTQIEGERADFYSDDELEVLINKRIINLGGTRGSDGTKFFVIKKLLGFTEGLDKNKFDQWVSWARANRKAARSLYSKFVNGEGVTTYSDIQETAAVLASSLNQMGWVMTSDELARSLLEVFELRDKNTKAVVLHSGEIAINLLNMLCPTFTEKDTWNTAELGKCVLDFTEHFKKASPWIEFLLNPTTSITDDQIAVIEYALNVLIQKREVTVYDGPRRNGDAKKRKVIKYDGLVDQWFSNPKLSPLYPGRWLDFGRKMGVAPPDDMLESIRRITKKFKGRSNEEAIHPTVMNVLLSIVKDTQLSVLQGIPLFLKAVDERMCDNGDVTYWTQCALSSPAKVDSLPEKIKVSLQVKNTDHGRLASPFDGSQFGRIMFFESLADLIVQLFDKTDNKTADHPNKPRVIEVDLGNPNDELMELLSISVATTQAVDHFITNVRRKLNGLPVKEQATGFDLRKVNEKGFARLVAMTTDVLVYRTKEERREWEEYLIGIFAHLTNILPKGSHFLDKLSITAALTTLDSLPDYRRAYLATQNGSRDSGVKSELKPDSNELYVERESITRNLPAIMRENFPRTYESCVAFGFEKSCGIAIDEILADPSPTKDPFEVGKLYASELDAITIVAAGMEGLMRTCDQDGDYMMHWNMLKGDDELDCGFSKTKEVVMRLMDSGILKKPGHDDAIRFLLDVLDSNALFRVPAKGAMVRGTRKYMWLSLPVSVFYNGATLGSVYGLVSDIADKKRARSLK